MGEKEETTYEEGEEEKFGGMHFGTPF